jgi:hypothetical protein
MSKRPMRGRCRFIAASFGPRNKEFGSWQRTVDPKTPQGRLRTSALRRTPIGNQVDAAILPPSETPGKGSNGPAAPADSTAPQDNTALLRTEAARLAAEHHQRSAARGVADDDADLDALNHELGGQP